MKHHLDTQTEDWVANQTQVYINSSRSKDLSQQVADFISKGGVVKPMKQGEQGGRDRGYNNKVTARTVGTSMSKSESGKNRQEAKNKGLIRFNGSDCRVCGTSQKQTSNGACTQCQETRRKAK